MTAYLVLRAAKSDPAVLEETVTFSKRADATRGSTSGLREGEQVTVRELLYGLLLPSGNDASVALAEHFGARLGSDDSEPYDAFVGAMNAAAAELGMENAHYTNPHGLSNRDHVISARDLLRLTIQGSRAPVVSRDCRHPPVRLPRHQRRRLLPQRALEEHQPIVVAGGIQWRKTGTTGAAGACLVSCGRRDEDERIVVVLGSSSSDARYADTRNLFRWSWQQPLSSPTDPTTTGQ